MASGKHNKSKSSAKSNSRAGARKGAPKKSGAKSANRAQAVREPRLDENSRNDILGVILAIMGIALFIAVLSPQTGVVAKAAGDGLRYAFGVGAIIVPLTLVIWGATFFVRDSVISKGRIGLGLAISVLAIISMVALNTPNTQLYPDLFFDPSYVQAYGGYVGAALAWALSVSLGATIAYVVLGGVLVIGLIVIGFSISGIVQRVRDGLSKDGIAESDKVAQTQKQPKLSRKEAKAAKEAEKGAAAGKTQKIAPTSALDFDEDYVDVPQVASGKTAVLKEPVGKTKVIEPVEKREIPKGVAPRALEGFELPDMGLLRTTPQTKLTRKGEAEFQATAHLLQETLETFDIKANVVDWVTGPTVTMFRVEMPKGVRLNKITNLADDLQLALAANTVRIMAPIPGTSLVGIEIPNMTRSAVTLGDVIANTKGGPLMLGIGKDVEGDPVVRDLASMPHLLIGGTTGSGKSVAINSMLMSIIMRSTPAEVRLILVDPKRVELSLYNGVPHLYVPVVTEPREAASALAWAVTEMERRLKVLQKAGARNIGLYNQMVQDGALEEAEELPYLVIVIDELADLMMVAAKEVEDSICRIAQLARAAGIHLIVATQRPEANVVTGLIKANITNRIAFNVASSIDSRVILDQPGAEKLIGLGDLLFSTPEWAKPKRIQGAYVGEQEITDAVEHLKKQGEPEYHEEILQVKVSSSGGGGVDSGDDDPLIWEAAEAVVSSGMGSTSMLQRRLKVGYARAGRIMDMLEAKGVVGPPDGSKPREVLVDEMDLETLKAFESQDNEE